MVPIYTVRGIVQLSWLLVFRTCVLASCYLYFASKARKPINYETPKTLQLFIFVMIK